ncbi:MAG: hypothetical protein U5R49_27535 [Deltaproteobacteria bacterium]|nr:hypothetical protein [Deltaproteobacteria bacterium]
MADQKQPKRAVSVTSGIFLCVVGLVFFALGFSVLPLVGFLIALIAIVCGIFFFIRARRIGKSQTR